MRFSRRKNRAPHSFIADTTGVSSIMLQLHYKVMTSVCGLLEGISASGGGTRVLIYLVRDVVVY